MRYLLFCVSLLLSGIIGCGAPREIKVERNGVVIAKTDLGPLLVSGGVLFRISPPEGTYSLTVAGTFNQWDPTVTLLTNNNKRQVWMGFAPMEHKGVIHFKYIRNGSGWLVDPLLGSVDDGYGGRNSFLDLDKAARLSVK